MKTFKQILCEAGRGRPKKGTEVSNKASQYSDKEKDEGKRSVTLIGTVKTEDGKEKTEIKKIGIVGTDEVKTLKKEFEQVLYKKYGYDSEVEVEAKIGDYSDKHKAQDYERDSDVEHSIRISK